MARWAWDQGTTGVSGIGGISWSNLYVDGMRAEHGSQLSGQVFAF